MVTDTGPELDGPDEEPPPPDPLSTVWNYTL